MKILTEAGNLTDYSNPDYINNVNKQVFQPVIKILELGGAILDKMILLFKAIKTWVEKLHQDKIKDNLMIVENMIIHKKLISDLEKLGLTKDWMKLVIGEKERSMFLKNVNGVYVAINNKLKDTLGVDKLEKVLGVNNTILKEFVGNNRIVKLIESDDASDGIIKDFGKSVEMSLPNNGSDNFDVFKYGVKNKNDELIAIFGIVTETSEERERYIKTVGTPEEEFDKLLEILKLNK